jgi:hypothetical protein
MTEFTREDRYIVIKRSHMTEGAERDLAMVLEGLAIDPVDAVVVEADWPEYEPVWQMIEARVSVRPPASDTAGDALRIAKLEGFARRARRFIGSRPAKIADDIDEYFASAALSQPSPDGGADLFMDLAAAFGPVLKESFPDSDPRFRYAVAAALSEKVRERAHWFAAAPSPDEGAGLARGLERAAQWHDARCKTPDVFEQELHENSAKALRHLAANPDATDMQALEAALTPSPDDSLGRLREADWLNLMPREIVARAALNEGCREQTAAEIRGGSHRFVKISAEVAVKLVGFIQEQAREALALSTNSKGSGS